jgi:gliding motility-associated-like protein
MSKDMSTNPIEELRHLEAPVTEKEWSAILQDKRYVQKFGRKPGFSPKGRAGIIAGVVVALITIPILVKTLSHESKAPVQEATTTTETVVNKDIASQSAPSEPSSVATVSESTSTAATPAKVKNTSAAATAERSTVNSVVTARTQPLVAERTNEPSAVSASTVTPSSAVAPTTTEAKIATTKAPQTSQTISKKTEKEEVAEVVTPKSEPEAEPEETEADQFFIPSAFTPNGDGLNDLFYVKANFEPRNFEMTIMSRNGDLLFHSRDINIGWDGQLHGSTLPHGMYVYIIKYKDSEGKDQKQQGQILLIP